MAAGLDANFKPAGGPSRGTDRKNDGGRIVTPNPWGVELGKVLARRIIPELENHSELALGQDSSANGMKE